MTLREKLQMEFPEKVKGDYIGGCSGCPHEYGYGSEFPDCFGGNEEQCQECWDREIPEPSEDFDVVHHPSHYTEGRKYEPRKVIRDWGLNFNLGSAVKYIARAGRKDDILQDLSKAKQFIEFEIEAITEERKNG